MLENVTPNSPGMKRCSWTKDAVEPIKHTTRCEDGTVCRSEKSLGAEAPGTMPEEQEWDARMQKMLVDMQSVLECRLLQVLESRLPPEDEFTKLSARVAILEKQVFDRSQSDVEGRSGAMPSGRSCSREDDNSSVDTRFVDHDCDPVPTPRSPQFELELNSAGDPTPRSKIIQDYASSKIMPGARSQQGMTGCAHDSLSCTVRCTDHLADSVAEDVSGVVGDALSSTLRCSDHLADISGFAVEETGETPVTADFGACEDHAAVSAVDDANDFAFDEERSENSAQVDPRRRCWNTPALPPEDPPPLPCDLIKGLQRRRGVQWPRLFFLQSGPPSGGSAAASERGRAERSGKAGRVAGDDEGTWRSDSAEGPSPQDCQPATGACALPRARSHPPQQALPLNTSTGSRAPLHLQNHSQHVGSKLVAPPHGRVRHVQAERATIGAPVTSPRRITTPSPPPAALRGRGSGRASAPFLLNQQGQQAQLPPTGFHSAQRRRSPQSQGRQGSGQGVSDVVYVPNAAGWSVTLPNAVQSGGAAVARRRSNSTLGGKAGDGDC